VTTPSTRIVIAEDEAIIRMDLRELLEEVGYDVVADCGRGDEALRLIREIRPDLAILDVKMPGLDGISVAAEVAPERICPIVLVTAFSDRELVGTARDAGVMAYLVKPFQREDLVPAIEVALGRFADLAEMADRTQVIEDQLAVRRLIDRAKALLIRDHSLSEEDAFRFLQRTAMNQRQSLRAVAEAVLAGELTP
jgi:response regulator NasT